MYEDDGALPEVNERVIVNQTKNSDGLFNEETAAFEAHPALTPNLGSDKVTSPTEVFIEHAGIYDGDGVSIPRRELITSGIRTLTGKKSNLPDLIIPRGSDPVPEYGNLPLFPGMFPVLFPYGVEGFEDNDRDPPISFQKQVEYFLDLADNRFRKHRSFIFIAPNIYQRCLAHLRTSLAIRRSRFSHIAPKIQSLNAVVIEKVPKHVGKSGRVEDLSPQEQDVLLLLKEVKTISGKIPGSSAAKLKMRNEIQAYMGYFGLPHLFITMNPNATHDPVFQVMSGDQMVDLTQRFPELADSVERGVLVASDPATGADFFKFKMDTFIEDLIWSMAKVPTMVVF